MRATHRRETASVIEHLLAAPQDFQFVQAVSILLDWLAGQGVPFEEGLRTRLRFENSLRLAFPASEVEAIARVERSDGGDAAGAGPCFTITPTFMGLLGVHGALPLQVTERIAAWQSEHGDAAPRAFLDLLSNRMLALCYRAWRKNRVEHMAQSRGGSDAFRPLLLALAGCPPAARSGPGGAVPDDLVAHFAGMLQQQPRSGIALKRVLGEFFGVRVDVEEAVGYWDRLQDGERAALGVNAELGENVLLGERSWRPDLRARLRIGPLDADTFARFLPSGAASASLRAILRRFAEPTVGFEVQLVLRAQEVRPVQLAGAASSPARLGRDSFLVTLPARDDRADMRYLIMPMDPLAAPVPPFEPRS
jgi:type VI secretion system protein ImpH